MFVVSQILALFTALNLDKEKNVTKPSLFLNLFCSCTIFVLISYSFDIQVRLILILINVQYSQNAIFRFEKNSNCQNNFSSGL